jgi:phosphotransferase system enzyme I (PtsI)
MVSTLDEFRRAKQVVDETTAELAGQGAETVPHVQTGIMIEVPAAALTASELAREVDFFSIGTNDLTQYTMAADRGAARVAQLYSPLQPAVLRLIAMTVEAAHAEGKWVGMCGEAAGNPAWAGLWIGLGLDELSMSPPAIPEVKEAIRCTQADEARDLARRALAMPTLSDIEQLLRKQSS